MFSSCGFGGDLLTRARSVSRFGTCSKLAKQSARSSEAFGKGVCCSARIAILHACRTAPSIAVLEHPLAKRQPQLLHMADAVFFRYSFFLVITFTLLQLNPLEVLHSATFWTSRGYRCLPFPSPALAFSFISHGVRHSHCFRYSCSSIFVEFC